MPTRLLREGILDSEGVNSLSLRGEIFYRRLMSVVDDYGRFEANPKLLRLKLFGFQMDKWTEDDVVDALDECSGVARPEGLVRVYKVKDKLYLEINNFGQRIRAGKSKCPEPPSSARRVTVKRHAKDSETPQCAAQTETNSESNAKSKTESNKKLSPADAGEKEALSGLPEIVLETVVAEIHRRHPAVRRCGPAEIRKNLLAILRKFPKDERIEKIAKISSNHEAWCATEDWQKEGGQFAKGLANWLSPTKDRWDCSPDLDAPKTASGLLDYAKLPGHMNPGLLTD